MTDEPTPVDDFEKFRELLNQEYQFPAVYLHKFIGRDTEAFRAGVAEFERKFIGLKRTGEKRTASGSHWSLTYAYHAVDANDVIAMARATREITDLQYIL